MVIKTGEKRTDLGGDKWQQWNPVTEKNVINAWYVLTIK